MDAIDLTLLLDQGLAVSMGLALATTCGLRAFLPLLVISILGALGKVELGAGFAWMASPAAIACFSTAVIAEIVADKVPAVDHALDVAGMVVKPTAAAVAAASMVTGFDPMLALVLGLITGGVAAETVHIAKAKARVLSSAFTGTIANPVLSTAEDVLAIAGVTLSVLVPVLGLLLFATLASLILWRFYRRRSRRSQPLSA